MPVILLGGVRVSAPSEITGCTGWWAAGENVFSDAGTTPAVNNDPLYRWGSKIDAHYVQQTTLGNRPLYKTAIVNGLPVVRFDGIDDVMDSDVALSTFMAVGAKTAIFVYRWTSVANNNLLGDTVGKVALSLTASGETLNSSNDDGVVDTASNTAATAGNWEIGTFMHNGTNVYAGVSDTRTASMASAASGNTTSLAGTMRFGATVAVANPLGGDIAEVAVFNTAVSEEDRQAVERYFASKFGIALPY